MSNQEEAKPLNQCYVARPKEINENFTYMLKASSKIQENYKKVETIAKLENKKPDKIIMPSGSRG
ncbi:8752_t:CDS:2, partial [Gigaspora rosea]